MDPASSVAAIAAATAPAVAIGTAIIIAMAALFVFKLVRKTGL
jgi:hypothetical protein